MLPEASLAGRRRYLLYVVDKMALHIRRKNSYTVTIPHSTVQYHHSTVLLFLLLRIPSYGGMLSCTSSPCPSSSRPIQVRNERNVHRPPNRPTARRRQNQTQNALSPFVYLDPTRFRGHHHHHHRPFFFCCSTPLFTVTVVPILRSRHIP